MSERVPPKARFAGIRKNGLPTPSRKVTLRAADVIAARAELLLSPELRRRLTLLAALHVTGSATLDAALLRTSEQADGLFSVADLRRLAADWPKVLEQIDRDPGLAGLFCGVTFSEPTGLSVAMAPVGDATAALIASETEDRRHAGKGPAQKKPGGIHAAVLSISLRIGGLRPSAADEQACDILNAGRAPADWIEPARVKNERQRLRAAVARLSEPVAVSSSDPERAAAEQVVRRVEALRLAGHDKMSPALYARAVADAETARAFLERS
ncbi:hypothetical protein [Conexibacter sp. DBS9H8]|uniref:hypothetical protein n=1 Tax=Conexibacter sp. DBS9H8 TaxID=2937801 RepID=UPI00200C2D11|nr:hypothetical protein [Conexibacter sp. DBS9H8]